MNTMCRNIIEKSVIGVLIYAGKRFVDKCFFDKKNVSDCSTTSCVFDFLLRCTPL